jgi:lysophospholipase L1-like esterase
MQRARSMRRRLVAVLTTSLVAGLACRAAVRADAAAGAAPPSPSSAPPSPSSAPASRLSSDAAPRPSRIYAVAAIGDSLTDPRVNGGRYLKFLAAKCPESRFDSYGVGGEMVNQMRRRFERDLFGIPPDPGKPHYTHVIVFGGVNDLYSDLTATRTVKKITSDLAQMYASAHEHGLRVVALTVTPWGGLSRYFTPARAATTAELNLWILAQPRGHAVDFAIDAFPLLSCGNPDRLCESYEKPFHDGVHFGPEGHRRIAEALFHDVFSDCR